MGRAAVIPPGLPPGSDVGNMSILGYDPAEYHTGRAPIEAAAMGVELGPDDVAYRCNLVTVDDGVMVDFAGGHPTDAQSHPIVAALDATLGAGRDGVRFHAGVEYRHLCVTDLAWADACCVPPHDLTGQAATLPTGPAAEHLRALMAASRHVVTDAARAVACPANQIWLWGQGVVPTLPAFTERFGVEGRLSSAVDLVRGLGVLTGLEVVDVPGATAGFDNDYAAQTAACLASLADRDLFLLHVEATDEAGHQGDIREKVTALERWDTDVIGPLTAALRGEPHRILLLPDHATPCAAPHPRRRPCPVPARRRDRPRAGWPLHRSRRRRPDAGPGASPHAAPRRLSAAWLPRRLSGGYIERVPPLRSVRQHSASSPDFSRGAARRRAPPELRCGPWCAACRRPAGPRLPSLAWTPGRLRNWSHDRQGDDCE